MSVYTFDEALQRVSEQGSIMYALEPMLETGYVDGRVIGARCWLLSIDDILSVALEVSGGVFGSSSGVQGWFDPMKDDKEQFAPAGSLMYREAPSGFDAAWMEYMPEILLFLLHGVPLAAFGLGSS